MVDSEASGDWVGSQAEVLLRVARRMARSFDLSYCVLQRVAQGTLTPTAVRETLAVVGEAHRQAYAARLGALSARFFGGLLQVATGEVDPPPSVELASAEPELWLAQLSAHARTNAERAVRRYRNDVDRVSSCEIPSNALETELAEAATRQSAQRLRALGELYLDLLRGLSDLGADFEDDSFRRLLAAGPAMAGEGQILVLTAPLGGVSSGVVTIENTRSTRVIVRCLVTDVRRADGVGPAFLPLAKNHLEDLALEPGQEADVRVCVALDPGQFRPGFPYVGAVRVSRDGEADLDIPLHIVATPPAASESAPS